jgi:type VII secretion protein EccB
MRDTDPAQSPFRKVAAATLAGALFAAIGIAGAAVYGLLAGQSVNWKADGQVIIEKETGTRYVLYDGKLHPAANFASALLVASLKGAVDEPKVVARSSLKDAPRGAPIGIPGAPDALPTAKQLLTGPWTLCSRVADQSGGAPTSTLLLGAKPSGGTRVADDQVLRVSTPDGKQYAVYGNRRYAVTDPLIATAFAWGGSTVPVAPAVVAALPAGPDLRRITIAGAGNPTPNVPGARIGQVVRFASENGARLYLLVVQAGLAELTQAEVDLIHADPSFGGGGEVTLDPVQYSNARKVGLLSAALPFRNAPKTATAPRETLCLSIADDRGPSVVTADPTVPARDAASTPASTAAGAVLADRISVPPGTGALVEARSTAGVPGGALSVVTDQGLRYPVASRDVANKLGYGSAKAKPLPAQVVSLLPVGPALDPTAAVKLVQRP